MGKDSSLTEQSVYNQVLKLLIREFYRTSLIQNKLHSTQNNTLTSSLSPFPPSPLPVPRSPLGRVRRGPSAAILLLFAKNVVQNKLHTTPNHIKKSTTSFFPFPLPHLPWVESAAVRPRRFSSLARNVLLSLVMTAGWMRKSGVKQGHNGDTGDNRIR